tara:strand:+ start:1069 stop:1176 length:108 start_codon:yes stop_codon:yes gene_type:complete
MINDILYINIYKKYADFLTKKIQKKKYFKKKIKNF